MTDAEVRRADLIQLEQIASGYRSRERLLTELTLDPPDATSDQAGVPLLDEDYLILSTIHSAKGQEWKSVFVHEGSGEEGTEQDRNTQRAGQDRNATTGNSHCR
jgi:superfamily I DNA/RNA helicase